MIFKANKINTYRDAEDFAGDNRLSLGLIFSDAQLNDESMDDVEKIMLMISLKRDKFQSNYLVDWADENKDCIVVTDLMRTPYNEMR